MFESKGTIVRLVTCMAVDFELFRLAPKLFRPPKKGKASSAGLLGRRINHEVELFGEEDEKVCA